jgi:hypothetical protein
VRRLADGARWEVQLEGGLLVALSDVRVHSTRFATQRHDCRDCRGYGLHVEEECLLSVPSFEIQGRLEPWTNGKLPERDTDVPGRLTQEPRLLYMQVTDSIIGGWDVEILTHAGSPYWSRRILAGAGGSNLIAFAPTPEGAVDVLVRDDTMLPPGMGPKCAGRARLEGIDTEGRPAVFLLLRIDLEGTVTALQ